MNYEINPKNNTPVCGVLFTKDKVDKYFDILHLLKNVV